MVGEMQCGFEARGWFAFFKVLYFYYIFHNVISNESDTKQIHMNIMGDIDFPVILQ